MPPSTLTGLQWSGSRASSSFVFKSHAQEHLFPLRRLKRFVMGPQILKTFYSCTIKSILAASLLGMAISPPSIRWRYREWCGQPSTSLGPRSLPSRTFIYWRVKGRPGRLLRTPATQAILFSLHLYSKR
jgi:hypothetical protein